MDDYFEDTFSEERIFESQYNIERYFNGAVNQLPKEGRIYYWCSVPGATGSDEAVSCGTFYNGILDVSFPGTELTTDKITYTETGGWDWNFNVWPNCYKVIRKVNTILPHIDEVPDMNAFDKMEFRARARFLRAYAYYWILQNQGPMILVGDQVLNTNETPDYYQAERSTYDECVDYICSELEAAAESLETEQPLDLFGSPTKGAALALVARLRLQAASPLFNGGAAARRYFGAFKRKSDGVHYISQTYDESKWAVAAAAAKRVIDLGIYRLHTVPADEYTLPLPSNVPSDPFPAGAGGIDPFRSYSEMFTGETTNVTNPELIWGTTQNITDQQDVVFPLKLGGNSSISIPQRIVDAYRMADGRDINNASAEYPYEDRPYDQTCVTAADKQLSKNYTLPGGTYKAYDNREPRFYASIGFSGTLWQMQSTTSEEMRNKIVEYYNGANAGKNQAGVTNIYNLTGYTCYKYVHPRDARTGSNARTVQKTFPLIRYAEILLSYAEALNNLTKTHEVNGQSYSRDLTAMAGAFNQVRYRAGLPGADAGELVDATSFNELIRRERMVEFLHENRRYYDICRWGIFEELEREPLTGLNVEAGNGRDSTPRRSSRTVRSANGHSSPSTCSCRCTATNCAKYRAWIRTRAGRNSQFQKIQKMKAFSKITILAAAAAFLCSCEMEYYKEELYRKEIFIVSGENNILGQEFEYGEKGFQGELAIYASGTTGLDQNVTVKLGLDFEAIGEYNKRNFDTKFEEYAMELPAEYYTIDPMSVEMEAGSCSASLPINVRVDELLPDQTYFIPLRIESVSSCMPSATKNFVLFEIQRRNDYATTKSSTYYTMTGTTQTGWIVDNIFGSNTRRQAINSSKLVIPVGERSVRILPGATAANDKVTTRNNSLRVTVDPESWVNVPVYVEGEITDEVVPMQRVSITPYLDSQDAIRVSASPLNDSTYDPATGTFYLYYRYQLATESGNTWHEVRETMTRSQY